MKSQTRNALFSPFADANLALDRTTTGISQLDALLQGGFPRNRAIVVCGSPGTGKTTLGIQFLLEGLARGDLGIFVSAEQSPARLLEDATRFEWNLQPAMARGVITLLDAAPFHAAARSASGPYQTMDPGQVAHDLVQEITRIGARRLVIDSVTSLVPPEMSRGATHDYLRSLLQALEDNAGCTTVLTCRGSSLDPQGSCEAARSFASGVIELRLEHRDPEFVRIMRVRKMRGTAVHPSDFRFDVASGWGLVFADQSSVDLVAS
jgi:circadian clock protein KaiC